MQDFDDLPSVKSRDMISQMDDVSDTSFQQNQAFQNNTPREGTRNANKVHKETPIIDKRSFDPFAVNKQSSASDLGGRDSRPQSR